MFERLRQLVLRAAHLPHNPSPPAGAPGSLRVFRAGINYYRLRLLGWGVGQGVALAGLLVSFAFLSWLKHDLTSVPVGRPAAARATTTVLNPSAPTPAPSTNKDGVEPRRRKAGDERWKSPAQRGFARTAERLPPWLLNALARWSFPVLVFFEIVGLASYLIQLVVTYAALRLDYELRWYMVTDRSLRIRTGLFSVQELTMSFANLQQVEVAQGPIQRLLKIADVQVQSAGGGGGGTESHGHGTSLHTGILHGVDNAAEIRDLILERLRLFRTAGLGDPEDKFSPSPHPSSGASAALEAARELLVEVRALRQALG